MSDRLKLAREIAARTELRFIEIKPEPRRKVSATFIEVPRQRGGGRVPSPKLSLLPCVADLLLRSIAGS